jgi:hypothetical protein
VLQLLQLGNLLLWPALAERSSEIDATSLTDLLSIISRVLQGFETFLWCKKYQALFPCHSLHAGMHKKSLAQFSNTAASIT